MVFSSYRNKGCIDQKQTLIDLLIDWLAQVFICQHVSVRIGDRCSYYCLQLKLLDYCDALAMGCQSTSPTPIHNHLLCFCKACQIKTHFSSYCFIRGIDTVFFFFFTSEISLWRKGSDISFIQVPIWSLQDFQYG